MDSDTFITQEKAREALDLLESAWGVIANAGEGNWERESAKWQDAATLWRDKYHALIGVKGAGDESDG